MTNIDIRAKVRTMLGIPEEDTQYDELIDTHIGIAQSKVAIYLGVSLWDSTYPHELDEVVILPMVAGAVGQSINSKEPMVKGIKEGDGSVSFRDNRPEYSTATDLNSYKDFLIPYKHLRVPRKRG